MRKEYDYNRKLESFVRKLVLLWNDVHCKLKVLRVNATTNRNDLFVYW